MANTKKVADKKIEEKVEVVESQKTTTSDSNNELKIMLETMSQQFKAMQEMNADLLKENQSMKSQLMTMKQPDITNDEEKVYIVHLRDMRGSGLTTHIALTNTARDLITFGEIMTLSVIDFEELAGKYLGFFDKGIIAVDARSLAYAKEKNLPIYDTQTKEIFNANTLSRLGDMTENELKDLFDKLCYENQQRLLEYWMERCYRKEPKFWDRNKMSFLNKISDSEVFDDLIFQYDNDARRVDPKNNVQKIDNLGVI